MPLLAFFIPLEVAAPLAVLVSITIAGIVVVQDWKKIHLPSTGWLVLSTLFGIPLGLLLLTSGHQRTLKGTLGLFIVAFSVYSLIGRAGNRPLTAGVKTREPGMATGMWILCRSAGRSLRHEWSAAGHLRSHAPLVRATFPGDSARIFSASQHHWHGWLLARRTMDSGRDALLSAFTAGDDIWQYFSAERSIIVCMETVF